MKPTLKVILFFLLFAINYLPAQAQNKPAYLRLRIYGSKRPLCRLDETALRTNDTLLAISPGKHHIRIWVPTTVLIDTTITTKAGDTMRCRFNMQLTQAYIEYARKYATYRAKENERYFVSPICIAATIAAGVLVDRQLAEKQYNNAINSRDIYNRLGDQNSMDAQKSNFDSYKKKYDNYRKLEYGIYGVAGLLAVNYVRILIKQQRTPAPLYKEETLLSKVKFDFYPTVAVKGWQCGLSMNF